MLQCRKMPPLCLISGLKNVWPRNIFQTSSFLFCLLSPTLHKSTCHSISTNFSSYLAKIDLVFPQMPICPCPADANVTGRRYEMCQLPGRSKHVDLCCRWHHYLTGHSSGSGLIFLTLSLVQFTSVTYSHLLESNHSYN